VTRVRVRGGAGIAERMARRVMRGILRCPLCGRSGGELRDNHVACERCRAELAPTALQRWRAALGMSTADMARFARTTTMTIARALRGEPLGPRTSAKLERLTRIPASHFRAGEPSPFARPAEANEP
jgi:hypothetical protein